MHSNNNVRDQVAARRNNRNTSLPKLEMNGIVEQRRCRVTREWREEDERDDDER